MFKFNQENKLVSSRSNGEELSKTSEFYEIDNDFDITEEEWSGSVEVKIEQITTQLNKLEDVKVHAKDSIEDTVSPEARIKNPTFIEDNIKQNTTQFSEIVDVPKEDLKKGSNEEEKIKEIVEQEMEQTNTKVNKIQENDECADVNTKIDKENTTVNLVQDELITKMDVACFSDTDPSQFLDVILKEDDTKDSAEEMIRQQHTFLESNDLKYVNENDTSEDIKWEFS